MVGGTAWLSAEGVLDPDLVVVTGTDVPPRVVLGLRPCLGLMIGLGMEQPVLSDRLIEDGNGGNGDSHDHQRKCHEEPSRISSSSWLGVLLASFATHGMSRVRERRRCDVM